jgi:hypothetical protein
VNLAQQSVDPLAGRERRIEVEAQFGRGAQSEPVANLAAQIRCRVLEPSAGDALLLRVAEDAVVTL